MAKKIEKYLPVDYSDSFSIEVTENLWKRRIKRDKCLRNACQ